MLGVVQPMTVDREVNGNYSHERDRFMINLFKTVQV